jgi:hypothetical protein
MRKLVAILFAMFLASPCWAESPSLVVAFFAKAADRSALRRTIEQSEEPKLRELRSQGLLSAYELLFARYPDRNSWDAMEVLHFKDDAAMARWRAASGGISNRRLLSLAEAIETTPTEMLGHEGSASKRPAILVIPYETLVSTTEYRQYLDGYTIPQFRGWMKAGVLDSFDILGSRYPAGRAWNALIILRYHDDAALGRREEAVAATRAALVFDPKWKAFSESKKKFRSERVLVIADQVAASKRP